MNTARAGRKAAALVSLALGGCGGNERPDVYVGAVGGTETVLAVAVEETGLTAYVCGGPKDYATVTRWFSNTEPLGSAFALEKDGFRLRGDLDRGEGELVRPDGSSASWTIHRATPGTLEGLYAALDGGCRTGVVVRQLLPGAPPSIQGTWCDGAGRFAQVTPILPVKLTADGLQVAVSTLPIEKTLTVEPLALP